VLLKQLEYLIAVVDENSFTEAAEKLYISQSAVSQGIQALERSLNARLLIRRGRSFTLTLAGQYCYRRAKALLGDLTDMENEIARIARGEAGELCVGYLNLYAGPELSEAIGEFSARHPDVRISTVSGTHEDLYEGIVSGAVNLALNDQRRAFSDQFENVELLDAGCSVEISARLLPEGTDSLQITQLPDVPCILISEPAHQQVEESYYRDILGVPGPFLFASGLPEARLMVVGGRGYLITEDVGRPPMLSETVCRIPLYRGKDRIRRKYCLFWQKKWTSEIIEDFAALFRKKITQ